MNMPREWYVPKGAVKISHKASSAVAYLYTNTDGSRCAAMFGGKRAKPDQRYRYRTDAERAESVSNYFANINRAEELRAEARAKRNAAGRGLEVGDILNTCWGHDQTNREFYEVVELVGKAMVVLRELEQTREDTGWEQWRASPVPGSYIGEELRRVAKDGRVKIDQVRTADKWDGQPKSASGYA